MLADLFGEEEDSVNSGAQNQSSGVSGHGISRPLSPRNKTGLCGMSNLGATCYMNALLQTLFYTPELRESLFALTREELGIVGEGGRSRDIPVQLQNLFGRLLLADQETVGVEGLISSFGWTNNEQLQQHDVQELNRILFDALESSLVGTSGQHLISHLFHGITVQQVTCGKCDNVSEREENFLDIPVALSGKAGLEAALKEMYCGVELLDGNNQYRCERCNCLVDAKRRCCMRKVPLILTFNLLRFLYDFDKGERYKDLSNFKFPQSLNMSPYLDDKTSSTTEGDNNHDTDANNDDVYYDLFSVVIHSGSTHSGHYIAYIKDIDHLGSWSPPEHEPVSLQSAKDVLEFNSPVDLLKAIIEQSGGKASINKICKQLSDQTGVTWNKRFKQQYGPITKFVRQCTDIFEIDSSNVVSLKGNTTTDTPTSLETTPTSAPDNETTPTSLVNTPNKDEEMTEVVSNTSQDSSPKELLEYGNKEEVWFEFNDSHISCIHPSSIEKMFAGRQSAYMLFYRLRSLSRPKEALGNPSYGVPQWLQEEIATTNAVLDADRQLYDTAVNTVTLTIHPVAYYEYTRGALQNNMDNLVHTIKIDRRKTVADLQSSIIEEIGDLCISGDDDYSMVINIAKQLPAGLHLYDCITNEPGGMLMDKGIINDSHLFVWNGMTVNDVGIPIGNETEPLLLHLNYPGPEGILTKVSCGFSKISTISELRQYFASLLNCSPNDVVLNQVKRSTRSGDASIQSIPLHKDKNILTDLVLIDGDHVTAELKGVKKAYRSFAYSVADKQNKMITFLVENKCGSSDDVDTKVYPVEVTKTEKLCQVKSHVISQLGLINVEGGGRLRVDDDFEGLGPSLCEELTVLEAGIESGMKVILEPGQAPLTNQIPLKCSVGEDFFEVILDRSCTIKEVCSVMVATMGLEGSEWHLRKTNWMGEAGEIVDDETATIEQLKFRDGDRFLIKEGRLPPKGFIRLSVFLYTLDHGTSSDMEVSLSVGDWFNGGQSKTQIVVGVKRSAEDDHPELMETNTTEEQVPLHEENPTLYYPKVPGLLTCIGNIEINKESTVNELKELIMTLPLLPTSDIPSCDFLRVRDLINGRPTRIFKDKTHSLKRLKLTSGSSICCQILPNEEALSATSVLFNMYIRQVGRTYSCPIEVVYDLAESTTPTGLCKHISNLLATPTERLVLAKHKFESFQWIRIEGHAVNEDKGKKSRKGKSGGGGRGGTHVNIKNAPVSLRDGDDIGVKDLQLDPEDKDDFMTFDDEKGKSILVAIQEEKRRRRKLKSEGDMLGTGGLGGDSRNKKQRRPEVGIKIFVPDFSKTMAEENLVSNNDNGSLNNEY